MIQSFATGTRLMSTMPSSQQSFPSFRPSAVLRNRHKTFMLTTKQADCSTLMRPTLDPTTASKVTRNISGPLQVSRSECFLGVSKMVLGQSTTTQTGLRGRDGWWLESFLYRYPCLEKPCWIRADYHQLWN